MHSRLPNLRSSLRLSNLIGRGMPERIRSVGFAFLGLTAAAGLALVAIFAQMSFPLLSPVPLPGGPPAEPSSVSKAVPVEEGSATAGLAQAQDAVAAPSASRGQDGGDDATRDDRSAGVDRSASAVSGAPAGDSPAGSEPVTTAPPATTDPAPEPVPAPTTTTTESTPPPDDVPVSSPDTDARPGKSTAVSSKPDKEDSEPAKPAVKPAKSKPAGSAKTRSAKPAKAATPAAVPAPEASSVPAPPPAAVGQDKEEKAKEEKKDK